MILTRLGIRWDEMKSNGIMDRVVFMKPAKKLIVAERKKLKAKHPKWKLAELRKRHVIFDEEYNQPDGEGSIKETLDHLGFEGKFEEIRDEAYADMSPPELGPWASKLAEADEAVAKKDAPPPFLKTKKMIDTSKFKFGDAA